MREDGSARCLAGWHDGGSSAVPKDSSRLQHGAPVALVGTDRGQGRDLVAASLCRTERPGCALATDPASRVSPIRGGSMADAAKNQMTSRERVRATVAGLAVDRVPVMTWLNPHAGCRLMAEFRPASDDHGNATGRQMWEAFSRGPESLSEDERA